MEHSIHSQVSLDKQENSLPYSKNIDCQNDAKFQMKQTLRQIEDMIHKINQVKQSKAGGNDQAIEASQFNQMIHTL